MVHVVRIKRRPASDGAGAPSTLANAELAFNEADNILYYGWGDDGAGIATDVIPIASADSAAMNWGIGLEETTPGTVDLQIAGATGAEIGGITVPAQSATQGLVLDAVGDLSAPLATDLLAGTIVEPPPDGLQYARSRDLAGMSSWVPTTGVFVGDAPPTTPPPSQGSLWFDSDAGKLYVHFDDGTSEQWIQVGGV